MESTNHRDTHWTADEVRPSVNQLRLVVHPFPGARMITLTHGQRMKPDEAALTPPMANSVVL